MGTNYYARINQCKCCKRSEEELHIGKSSAGWTFSFQAIDSPDYPKIDSYVKWIRFLSKRDVSIYDEYGTWVKVEELMEIIMHKRQEKHNHAKEYPSGYSLDNDGNSFNRSDFS